MPGGARASTPQPRHPPGFFRPSSPTPTPTSPHHTAERLVVLVRLDDEHRVRPPRFMLSSMPRWHTPPKKRTARSRAISSTYPASEILVPSISKEIYPLCSGRDTCAPRSRRNPAPGAFGGGDPRGRRRRPLPGRDRGMVPPPGASPHAAQPSPHSRPTWAMSEWPESWTAPHDASTTFSVASGTDSPVR